MYCYTMLKCTFYTCACILHAIIFLVYFIGIYIYIIYIYIPMKYTKKLISLKSKKSTFIGNIYILNILLLMYIVLFIVHTSPRSPITYNSTFSERDATRYVQQGIKKAFYNFAFWWSDLTTPQGQGLWRHVCYTVQLCCREVILYISTLSCHCNFTSFNSCVQLC